MATAKQKEAARRNIKKAQKARSAPKSGSAGPKGAKKASRSPGLSAADKDKLDDKQFAFHKKTQGAARRRQARPQRRGALRSGRGSDRQGT
jgi:hypothetical protein